MPYLLGLEVAVLLLLGLREPIGELLTEPGVVGAAHLCSDLGEKMPLIAKRTYKTTLTTLGVS